MPRDYIPAKDTVFQDWLGNFISIANANLATLGLITGDLTPLTTDKTTFDTNLTDAEAKKAASKAATQAKDTIRKSAEAKARALVKRIQAKADVPNALKAQLQITVPGATPPPPEIPVPPINLVANIAGTGAYLLTWDRAANSLNTLFVIEAKIGATADWLPVFTTTKTKYEHTGNPAGVVIMYRVKAQRGEIQSPPSNVAVVNEG
ncbi:MAG: hypothetical protein HW421_1993 [Ignavibacteria bacterium]|nr:hypothetical protein [Ignavibacteria bacterium]